MKLFVKVFATLRKRYPEINDLNPLVLEVKQGIIISEVLDKLGYTEVEIHLYLLNGKKVDSNTAVVEDESILSLFPPVGGG